MGINLRIKSYLFCSILESAAVRCEMETILRCENDVHVDALTVVDFTMLYVTGYMSQGWTIRKVMGGGGGRWGGVGQKSKKEFSSGAKPRNTGIRPATQARSNVTRIA